MKVALAAHTVVTEEVFALLLLGDAEVLSSFQESMFPDNEFENEVELLPGLHW